eukprot:IDg22925t1
MIRHTGNLNVNISHRRRVGHRQTVLEVCAFAVVLWAHRRVVITRVSVVVTGSPIVAALERAAAQRSHGQLDFDVATTDRTIGSAIREPHNDEEPNESPRADGPKERRALQNVL